MRAFLALVCAFVTLRRGPFLFPRVDAVVDSLSYDDLEQPEEDGTIVATVAPKDWDLSNGTVIMVAMPVAVKEGEEFDVMVGGKRGRFRAPKGGAEVGTTILLPFNDKDWKDEVNSTTWLDEIDRGQFTIEV
ncbi:hypothetical protein ACHAWF_004264 [Thalassiosira exigua]